MTIRTREQAAALGLAEWWDKQMGVGSLRYRSDDYTSKHVKPSAPSRRTRTVNDLGMNKLEARYAARLDEFKARGLIDSYAFEGLKFRLAGRTWFTPDFPIWMPDSSLIVVEAKGFMRDDAAIKLKLLAELRPRLRVYVVSYQRGAWVYRVCGRSGIVACESPFV